MLSSMGQRDDLMRGARQCIAEKGYSRTTARDIAAASGANLASIGYHFGSKAALLNAAVMESFDEWGDAVEEAMQEVSTDDPLDRLEGFLKRFLASTPSRRTMMVASMQAFAEAEFIPEIRAQLREGHADGIRSLAAIVLSIDPEELTEKDLSVGALALSLINGLSLQWLISPETAPSAADIATAIRRLAS